VPPPAPRPGGPADDSRGFFFYTGKIFPNLVSFDVLDDRLRPSRRAREPRPQRPVRGTRAAFLPDNRTRRRNTIDTLRRRGSSTTTAVSNANASVGIIFSNLNSARGRCASLRRRCRIPGFSYRLDECLCSAGRRG